MLQSVHRKSQAGRIEARKAGRISGRRPKLSEEQQREIIRLLESDQKYGAQAACLFGRHPPKDNPLLGRKFPIAVYVVLLMGHSLIYTSGQTLFNCSRAVRHMIETTALLADHALPHKPIRQWVERN